MAFGFTGTQRGMTPAQAEAVSDLLFMYYSMGVYDQLHHGMCIGADAEAHKIAKEIGYWTVGHPPISIEKFANVDVDEIREMLPYLHRDWVIARESHHLLAAPAGFTEEVRSGTWATIRYARKQNRRITYFWPDGTLTGE